MEINPSLGFVHHDLVETQILRYFYSTDNNPFFQLPVGLANEKDFDKLKKKKEQNDLFNHCESHRPSSERKFFKSTNFVAFIFHHRDALLGCENALLLKLFLDIRKSKHSSLTPIKKTYHDKLCFFHASAFKKLGNGGFADSTKYLVTEFLSKTGKNNKNFTGALPSELLDVEQIVQINLQGCSICCDEKQNLIGELSHQSPILFFHAISSLQYDNRICWSKNIDKFLKKYRCHFCDKLWFRSFKFQRHIRRCKERITHRYHSGC